MDTLLMKPRCRCIPNSPVDTSIDISSSLSDDDVMSSPSPLGSGDVSSTVPRFPFEGVSFSFSVDGITAASFESFTFFGDGLDTCSMTSVLLTVSAMSVSGGFGRTLLLDSVFCKTARLLQFPAGWTDLVARLFLL